MLATIGLLLAGPAGAADGDAIGVCGYRALLFGVERYDDPDLEDLATPHEDVAALAGTLSDRYGVATDVILDPDRRGILDAIDGLRGSVRDCEALIVYFAGHGVRDEAAGEGYWLPRDADDDSRATWISNADVAAGIDALPARHVLIVADSCFAGSLFDTRGLAVARPALDDPTLTARRLARDRSRWAITSGGDEPVQDQYRDGLSVFAYFLRQQLAGAEARYVSIDALFPGVRSLVVTNAAQTPRQGALHGHEGGQLVLVNREATTGALVDAPAFTAPAERDAVPDDPRPPAPDWWVAGIAASLGVFGIGGLLWLRTRRRPLSPDFVAARRETYQELWDRAERLHTDLRRGAVPPDAYVERVGEVNAYALQRGVHVDPADAELLASYLRALVALKRASGEAGSAAEADLATTGAFDVSTLQQAPELARLDEEVRALRERLRARVRDEVR